MALFGSRLQSTEAFKRWFGDSKVVDAHGEPLVVYHGTVHVFDVFKRTSIGEFGPAIYFSSDYADASSYATDRGLVGEPRVLSVYLSIQRPFIIGPKQKPTIFFEWFTSQTEHESDENTIKAAQAEGYDGIIYKRPVGLTGRRFLTHYVVFEPSQIKAVTSVNFDPASPSIFAGVATDTWGGVIFCYDRAARGKAAAALRLAKIEATYTSSASLRETTHDPKPTPRYFFNGATQAQVDALNAALYRDGDGTEIYVERS